MLLCAEGSEFMSSSPLGGAAAGGRGSTSGTTGAAAAAGAAALAASVALAAAATLALERASAAALAALAAVFEAMFEVARQVEQAAAEGVPGRDGLSQNGLTYSLDGFGSRWGPPKPPKSAIPCSAVDSY